MARIPLQGNDEMPADIAELCEQVAQLTGDDTALRAIAHRPDILRAFTAFYWPLQTDAMIGRKLVELIRLSIAQINQCANCLGGRYDDAFAAGLTEAMIDALPRAADSGMFDERELAAIDYAQSMARDHFSVGDNHFRRLHRQFEIGEVVEISMLVAQFLGVGRMFAALDATNEYCALR